MSSSEGGRELQLAKERLVSAKARVESVSKTFVAAKETKKQVAKTMENAKAHEECASKQLDNAKEATKQVAKTMETATRGVNTAHLELLSSQNEVKKAEESLKATEKRREVVTIDSDSEEEGNSKKKMKVSTEEEAKGEDTDDNENNNQIVVMGCGSAEVNGTYKEDEELKRIVNCRGCTGCYNNPVFVKDGVIWKGKQGSLTINKSHRGHWQIRFWPESTDNISPKSLYRTIIPQLTNRRGDSEAGNSLPPTNGWVTIDGDKKFGGQDPPPTLQMQL